MSVALGPLGRNGEATGSINSSGRMAAMSVEFLARIFSIFTYNNNISSRYSYSKTRGLFGGVSVEGSVIVERQDANSLAYRSDVTAKQLLSGSIDPPDWASTLINTLESCTGMPGSRRWINDENNNFRSNYAFGGVASPANENGTPSKGGKKKKAVNDPFPPPAWGQKKDSGSYFETGFPDDFDFSHPEPKPWDTSLEVDPSSPSKFEFHTGLSSRDSDVINDDFVSGSTFSPKSTMHSRSMSAAASGFSSTSNPFAPGGGRSTVTSHQRSFSLAQPPYIVPKPELSLPLSHTDGIARAIALYNFRAVEVCVTILPLNALS